MSAALEDVSTVKLLAAPSAEIAFAAVVLTGFAVPAVPVNTSTLPLSAAAGATPIAAGARNAPPNAPGLRSPLQLPIPLPPQRVKRQARQCAAPLKLRPSGSR